MHKWRYLNKTKIDFLKIILEKEYEIIKVLKDDKRSLVEIIEINQGKFIFKIPKEKNNRKWQRFINVTIPSISPIIFYNVLTALITHLQVINPALALTDGGPGKKSMFMSYVIYLYGFQKNKMGYAAAYSVIFFLLVGVFTVILFTTQKNQVFGEGE